MAKGAHIRERWKATAPIWEAQATFNGQVARRVNRVEVDGGEGEWRDDRLYINVFDKAPVPFAVSLEYEDGTWSYSVENILVMWWSSDLDNYVTLFGNANSDFSLPSSGMYACLYAKVTINSESAPAATVELSAEAASFQLAIEAAASNATGHNGSVRVLPLVVIGSVGEMYTLHRGVWYIGRES